MIAGVGVADVLDAVGADSLEQCPHGLTHQNDLIHMALESDCKKYIYQIKHQYDKITTLYTCTLHLVLGQ